MSIKSHSLVLHELHLLLSHPSEIKLVLYRVYQNQLLLFLCLFYFLFYSFAIMNPVQLILRILIFLRQDHGFDRQLWHFYRLLLCHLVDFGVRWRRWSLLLQLDMQQYFHVLLLFLSRHAVETALLVLVKVTD